MCLIFIIHIASLQLAYLFFRNIGHDSSAVYINMYIYTAHMTHFQQELSDIPLHCFLHAMWAKAQSRPRQIATRPFLHNDGWEFNLNRRHSLDHIQLQLFRNGKRKLPCS